MREHAVFRPFTVSVRIEQLAPSNDIPTNYQAEAASGDEQNREFVTRRPSVDIKLSPRYRLMTQRAQNPRFPPPVRYPTPFSLLLHSPLHAPL